MMIGRRPLFFAALCAVTVILIPATPAEYRWVNLAMGGLALFWAMAIGIEDVLTARSSRRRDDERDRPNG